MKKCTECKTNPIYNKKRGLCSKCYQRWRRRNQTFSPIQKFRQYESSGVSRVQREIEFIKNFFTHKNYIHQPAFFRLNGFGYSPDFYDGARNVFIEVVGSRQAYHQNKEKYVLFRKLFSGITLELRRHDGSLLNENSYRKKWLFDKDSTPQEG